MRFAAGSSLAAFFCQGIREARAPVEASNMTFQRKCDDAFKQKAVATVLQKGKKKSQNRPILGINEFLIYEWKGAFSSIVDAIPSGRFVRENTSGPGRLALCAVWGNNINLYPSLGGL